MVLSYDRVWRVFTLETDDAVEFLGPITHAQAKLRHYGFSASQAREAVLQAIFNTGAPVDLDYVQRVAGQRAYFSVNFQTGS